jgi:vancomycin resistance protein YoaR
MAPRPTSLAAASPRPRTRIHQWIRAVLLVLVIVAIIVGADYAYANNYKGRVFRGVRLGPTLVSGLNADAVTKLIEKRVDQFSREGITFMASGTRATVLPTAGDPSDPDVSYSWLSTDPAQSAAAALAYGRTGNWLRQRAERVAALVRPTQVPLAQDFQPALLRRAVEGRIGSLLPAAKTVTVELNSSGAIRLSDRVNGEVWLYDDAAATAARLASQLIPGEVTIASRAEKPDVAAADVPASVLTSAKQLLDQAPLTFTYQGQSWEADATTIASWLRFERRGNSVVLTVGRSEVEQFIASALAVDVNQSASAIKFAVSGGKATAFQPAQDGQQLDVPDTIEAIAAMVANGTLTPLALNVRTTPAPPSSEATELDIRELVAVGTSNFKGSPKNRRHNIKVGADAVNGTLIMPGQEFSLLKTLGNIDASTGYLPELVIKGNRTIPEYGGGLCQIGTTSFRSALAAGVPITERRNHSYRVVYYEPAGTDATIYSPAPDFKFLNDYPTPLLFQTHIDGDEVIFELWGVKDGRVATQTKPIITNVRAPAATRMVETLDLAPGEKKCTESAHAGADASFTYGVTYPNGQASSTVFNSHYVPWQAVCLVGVSQLSASSTPASSTVPLNP